MTDMVNHPPHYKDASGIECIEVTKYMGFLSGNCFKYLYRAGKKGSTVEDLQKAAWYAERAWNNNDIQPSDNDWRRNIREVARYREGYVHKAMMAIRWNKWLDAALFIKAEIERLEGEQ